MSVFDEMIPQVNLPDCSLGKWTVERFTAKPNALMKARASLMHRNYVPGEYTRLLRKHTTKSGFVEKILVMSDTPDERSDHLEFIINARGHVFISGLGLGVCLGAVLKLPTVDKVTIVEVDQELIDLISPHYQDKRVQIIRADVMEWRPTKDVRYGASWHDIWDNICSDNLKSMEKLNRRYGQKSNWNGCWQQERCRLLRGW